jgi:hypothetical protein
MRRALCIFAMFAGFGFAQCGSQWVSATSIIGASNVVGAIDAKPNYTCGSVSPVGVAAGTAGKDFYIVVPAGNVFVATVTGTPATWVQISAGDINAALSAKAPLAAPVFTGQPTIPDFTLAAHSHQNTAGGGTLTTAAIVSGVFGISFLPTGTSSSTVALGNHTHTGVYEVPLTFSAPLVRTVNNIALNLWGAGSRAVAANALGVSGNCVTWAAAGLGDAGAPCPSGGSGANALGAYWVASATNAPANAVNLGALSTGIVKMVISGGVATPSTAISGTDYQAAISGAPGTWPSFGALALVGFPSTGLVKSNGSAFSPAVSGTDYAPPTSGSVPLKGSGAGGTAAATAPDMVGLFSGCSGTMSLGADGACHAAIPAGPGMVYVATTGAGATAQPFTLGAGGTSSNFQRALEVYSTTVAFSNAALQAAAACATVTLLTGVDASWRFGPANIVQETTQFTWGGSITGLSVSVGSTTPYVNMQPALALGNAAAPQSFWQDTWPTPLMTTGNTYNVYAYVCATGANLGTGSATTLTAGALYIEISGYKVTH